jgi:hypothetical protein
VSRRILALVAEPVSGEALKRQRFDAPVRHIVVEHG